MASIPLLTSPRVPEGIVRPAGARQDVGDTRGAFGENQAAATGRNAERLSSASTLAGNQALQLRQAEVRIENMQDAILRAETDENLAAKLQERFNSIKAGGSNFANLDEAAKYNEFVDQELATAMGAALQRMRTPESQLQLRTTLSRTASKSKAAAVTNGLAENKARFARLGDQFIASQSARVATNPSVLDDVLVQTVEKVRADFADSQTPAETELMIGAALQQYAEAGAEFYLGFENYSEALLYLNRPVFSGVDTLELRIRAQVGLGKAANVGFVWSPEQLKAAGLDGYVIAQLPGKNPVVLKEPADELVAEPRILTPEEVLKFGLDPAITWSQKANGDFVKLHDPSAGTSDTLTEGGALLRLNRVEPDGLSLIERVTIGAGTPQEVRFALALATRSVRVARDTGQKFMDPGVAQMLLALDFEPETFGDTAAARSDPSLFEPITLAPETAAPADTSRFQGTSEGSAEGDPVLAAEEGAGIPTPAEGSDPAEGEVFLPDELTMLGGRTVAELVNTGNFTGIGPRVREFFGRTPIIGSGAGVVDTLRTLIPLAAKRLVTALQQNPRFAEGERTALQEDLKIEPSVFDNKGSMLGRLVAIDVFLQSLEAELEAGIKDLKQPVAARRADKKSLRLVQNARERFSPDIIVELDPAKRREAKIAFVEANPPGTPVIVMDTNDKWVMAWVPTPAETGEAKPDETPPAAKSSERRGPRGSRGRSAE